MDQKNQVLNFRFESLEHPGWMYKAGLDKGILHDRRPLGVVLHAGSKIRFRLKVPASISGVRLRLLNDGEKTEQSAEVEAEWRELTVIEPSVPFVETRYTDRAGELTEIEVEFVGGTAVLAIHGPGSNDNAFFNGWGTSAYALIDTKYAQILVPLKDKEVLRSKGNLTQFHVVYGRMFEYFNYLMGLSFDPAIPTDKNIPNRYFMKADKSGDPGAGGYYSSGHTAEVSDSVATFFLDTGPSNWGGLHEIAHGYQGFFQENSSLNLHEVWNNVFAALYQHKFMGDAVYTSGYFTFYEGGEPGFYERAMVELGKYDPYTRPGISLLILMLIFFRTGDQGVVEFCQRFRRISNRAGFTLVDYPAMDLLSSVVIDVSNSDVSPFMNFSSADLTKSQMVENAYSGATPVYPLYLSVAQPDLSAIQRSLGVRSPLHLVSRAQLAFSGKSGNVIFSVNSEILNKIHGKSLVLKSGSGKTEIIKIESNIIVKDLAVGVYAVQLPHAGDDCEADNFYLNVRSGTESFECRYVRTYASYLANQTISLNGFGGVFCTVFVDVSNNNLRVDVIREVPHALLGGILYGRVTVRNTQGTTIFDRQMMADKTELFSQVIPIERNYTIDIFHEEPVGVAVSKANASAVVDKGEKINTLKLTQQGLVNPALGTNAGENLLPEIEKLAQLYDRWPHLALHNDCPFKGILKKAINAFPEPTRTQLFERYKKIEFVPPPVSQSIYGQMIGWYFRGNADRFLGSVTVDTNSSTVSIDLRGEFPHEYFASVYLSILVRGPAGDIIYLRDLRGNAVSEAESVSLPFPIGSIISVLHREASRSYLEADANGKRVVPGEVQHATYTSSQTLSLASYWSSTGNTHPENLVKGDDAGH